MRIPSSRPDPCACLAGTCQDERRDGRTVADACSNPPRATDQRIKICETRSQTAQPTSYDHGRTRSTICGSERAGEPVGPVRKLGRDLRIKGLQQRSHCATCPLLLMHRRHRERLALPWKPHGAAFGTDCVGPRHRSHRRNELKSSGVPLETGTQRVSGRRYASHLLLRRSAAVWRS
jgi:hypothetical protein